MGRDNCIGTCAAEEHSASLGLESEQLLLSCVAGRSILEGWGDIKVCFAGLPSPSLILPSPMLR